MVDVESGLTSVSNAVSNFNPDSLLGVFDSPALAKIGIFLKVFAYLIFFVFAAILFWKFYLQYKIPVTVNIQNGKYGTEVKRDRAKIIVDSQGKHKLQLFKLRKGKERLTCPVIESSHKTKIGKKDHYFLWLDDNYQLHPVTPPMREDIDGYQEYKMEIKPQERDAWARMEDKAVNDKFKKKDMLEKFLPTGILIVAMMTAFLIWYFAVKELGNGLSGLATQFAQVASSCTHL